MDLNRQNERSFERSRESCQTIAKRRGLLALVLAGGVAIVAWAANRQPVEKAMGILTSETLSEGAVAPVEIPLERIEPLTQIGADFPRMGPNRQKSKMDVRQNSVFETLKGEKAEAAKAILDLEVKDFERLVKGSSLKSITGLSDLAPALSAMQEALRGSDGPAAQAAATEFLRLCSKLETDEAYESYWAAMKDEAFSEEFKTILIPAKEGAETLLSFGSGG